ncbi:MAG: hypothetical protein K1X53_09075 [Candidatus Sumerlaeaceae bacterium]|nr:hypothetical protein [Candidatus Sumerlaeaceae bacterium]
MKSGTGRLAFCVAIAALAVFAAPSQADTFKPRTNIRYSAIPYHGTDDFDNDDKAVFGDENPTLARRGGIPFYIRYNKGVLKTQPDASSDVNTTFEMDIETSVSNAVGCFILGATAGTQFKDISSIGSIFYEFDDGTMVEGNVMFYDHYLVADEPSQQGFVQPEIESPSGSIYTTKDGHLAEYHTTVIYHAFPKGKLVHIYIDDTPDTGEGSEESNCPIWIYGITVAREP